MTISLPLQGKIEFYIDLLENLKFLEEVTGKTEEDSTEEATDAIDEEVSAPEVFEGAKTEDDFAPSSFLLKLSQTEAKDNVS